MWQDTGLLLYGPHLCLDRETKVTKNRVISIGHQDYTVGQITLLYNTNMYRVIRNVSPQNDKNVNLRIFSDWHLCLLAKSLQCLNTTGCIFIVALAKVFHIALVWKRLRIQGHLIFTSLVGNFFAGQVHCWSWMPKLKKWPKLKIVPLHSPLFICTGSH